MCGFYCIVFIEYMFKRKTLFEYIKLLLLIYTNDYKKNDIVMYQHFKDKYGGKIKFRV